VAVLASEGEYLLPSPADETHFVAHFEREIVALGLDSHGDTLRMLLADLSLRAPQLPTLTLGDLLAVLDPPQGPWRRGLVDGRTCSSIFGQARPPSGETKITFSGLGARAS
jgi:hypothetical protein